MLVALRTILSIRKELTIESKIVVLIVSEVFSSSLRPILSHRLFFQQFHFLGYRILSNSRTCAIMFS